MDMSNLRPELHVAQQSRRDKLRVAQTSSSGQFLEDFTSTLEQSQGRHNHHLGLNHDLIHVRTVRNANSLHDPTLVSPGVLSAHGDAMQLEHQQFNANIYGRQFQTDDNTVLVNMFHPLSSSPVQGCGNWKIQQDSQANCDWMLNYHTNEQAAGRVSNIQNAMFVGDVLSNDVKPAYNGGHQDVHQSTFTNLSSEISTDQDSRKQYGDMQCGSPPTQFNYQTGLQNVVTVASVGNQNIQGETSHGSWSGIGDGLGLLTSYGNQPSPLRAYGRSTWLNKPMEDSHPWNDPDLGFITRKNDHGYKNGTSQALSLSLSSNPLPKICVNAQFGERHDMKELHIGSDAFKHPDDSKTMKLTGKASGKSLEDIVGPSQFHGHIGPLGPFTGYATILNSSRFLNPAQELLKEVCSANNSLGTSRCEVSADMAGEVSGSFEVVDGVETEVCAKTNNTHVSSPMSYTYNKTSDEGRMGSTSSSISGRPEYHQKKAKLLYLQDEISGRYKLYYQQMQMVISSFESVAGLNAATPYVSLAVKTVGKNFRCLKTAIINQLNYITRALGEDNSSQGDTNISNLKFMESSFQRHRPGGGSPGFSEPQHVWRPQRGLPERSVNVLRSWLFDHFLHPYPTDTDKHMLATQTGLSRNQVSNWFINARVRLWKPMVEEIHMLETKGLSESNRKPTSKKDRKYVNESSGRHEDNNQQVNKLGIDSIPNNKQFEQSGMNHPSTSNNVGDGIRVNQWNQEKRSRLECPVQTSLDDDSIMTFLPYQRSDHLEFHGLGSVSLTLGLRHGVENAQHHQEQLQQHHEDRLKQQFGSQVVHDFTG